ncbi:MAG: DMT family transporter [Verrucomicrobia bacterium]|jgi:drug/metabolite transporter (DMT)-like permease|nr:DMT family transporter [Verrucomicrobiota bacterium]
MLAAFLTTILFSCSAISGRRLSTHLRGTQANLARLILAAALLGAWSHTFGFGLGGAAFPLLFLSGCVGFGMGDLALFQTYRRLGARRAMVMAQCLAAPIATLIEWLWLGHAPSLTQTGFAALILGGVGVALLPHEDTDEPVNHLAAGILFGLVAAFGQGLGAVLSRKAYALAAAAGQTFHGVGDGLNAAYQRILGGIFLTALFFVYLRLAHKPDESLTNNWSKAWPWLVANCLCGPSLGVTCYQWALISTPTHIALPIVATTPLVVIPLAHWLEGDRVTKRAILGGVAAVAGVIGLTLTR